MFCFQFKGKEEKPHNLKYVFATGSINLLFCTLGTTLHTGDGEAVHLYYHFS